MATQVAAITGHVEEIPLSRLVPSKNNPRKSFNDASMLDLMESIKAHGVTSPILARLKDGKLEIVFGERRYRASKELKRETIPTIVKELGDEEADELRFVENLQREDLSPVEEAKEYERRWKGISPADISAKIGKPETHVVQRLRLLKLIPEAQEALGKDKILLGHAFELCKLREDEQKQALKWLLSARVEVGESKNFAEVKTHYSVEALKRYIQANFLLVLASAPFDTTDPKLNPSMGACTECQDNTANLGSLFPGVKDARCTVPDCFQKKALVALDADIAAVEKESGKKVFRLAIGYERESQKLKVDGYWNQFSNAIVEVEKGKECESAQQAVVVHVDPTITTKASVGKRTIVCVDEKCKVHHGSGSQRAAKAPLKGLAKVNHKAETLAKSIPQRVRDEAYKQLAGKLLAQAKLGGKEEAFSALLSYVREHLYIDRWRDAGKALGLEVPPKKEYGGPDWESAVLLHFDKNHSACLLAIVAAEALQDNDPENALYRMAAEYKVDVKKIEKVIASEDKAQITTMRENAKAREKGAKPKKAKAKKIAASAKKVAKKKH
jgi:ParB/RepB/Spo0J family partition protein